MSAETQQWWADYQREQQRLRTEAHDRGREEGRDEGRVEEAARALLTVLRARGIAVPEAERDRILAEKDKDRIERWLERAAVAASAGEVLEEAS